MKIIVPCCGSSSRFPGQPPKWTLASHDGRPMLLLALAGLPLALDDLVITILREHEDRFDIVAGLKQAFGRAVKVVILDERTRSQSETVARTLQRLELDEPFLIKDSDGYFELDELQHDDNYVCVDSLNNFDAINPRNKSYSQVDERDVITKIREKLVISDLFNVGGYYFNSPAQFLKYYERLEHQRTEGSREIYVSDVIGAMLADDIVFRVRRTAGYQDWGTAGEWRRALEARKTYFLMVDGFLFERGNRFFAPRFQDVKPHAKAVEATRSLAAAGHTIVYLSIRPESLHALTHDQLQAAGLPGGTVVWNCPTSKWVLLTSPYWALPLASGQWIETEPDDAHLPEIIGGRPS